MLIDFHSHHPTPYSIVCNADASKPTRSMVLLKCAGLLPNLWTEDRQQKLFNLLDTESNLHMGEVGLDRRFEHILPMDRQAEILRQEMSFAIEKDRCISLHCVRATKLMLDILKEMDYRPYSILWHGFTESSETAGELKKLNVLLSIGPRFRGNLSELLAVNPFIVPETDYEGSDDAEHQELLRKQYLHFPECYSDKASQLFRLFSKGC